MKSVQIKKQTSGTDTILWLAISIMLLTTVHHIYGAIIYDTPFRLHIAYLAVPVSLVLGVSHALRIRLKGSVSAGIARRVFLTIVLLVPVATFGFLEGGFNHVVKNILYYSGASRATLDQLFPPPDYVMPDDFWFELTGSLQFVLGVYTLYYLVRLVRCERAVRAAEQVSNTGNG